ncbi:MAG: SHOCT domain-containing protein [Chromatiaceae bacterium]|nr:SHOCT domain-containing protein [Chromatiaceae bacterium]
MFGFDHFGMGWGGLGMVLIWVLPILLGILLVRYFARDREERREPTALEILEARYARGEIDRDEYLKRRADLTSIR